MERIVRQCVVLLLAAAVVGAAALGAPSSVGAQPPSRAALVVHSGDRTITHCVSFEEPQVNGYDVLERSGLEVTASFGPMGAAICAIEGIGCSSERCLLCEAPKYWSYWRVVDGAWTYLQRGPSLAEVTDGDVQGWAWGEGDPPPLFAFEEVCEPPSQARAATLGDAPAPTEEPEPTPTDPASKAATVSSPTATVIRAAPTASTQAEQAILSPTPVGGVAQEPPWTSYALFGGLASGLLAAVLWLRHQRG
jgi:hypothetical protein